MGKSTNRNEVASNTILNPSTRNPRTAMPRDSPENVQDPYLPGGHFQDGSVCTQCGAVFQKQHWTLDAEKRNLLVGSGGAIDVVCPACKITTERNPQGIVTLSGDYLAQHRDDILNLVRNEEERGMSDNPLERIINIREEGEALVIETTNEALAQRIGRRVHKAHSGDVEYKWSGGNHLVRVNWQRSLEKK